MSRNRSRPAPPGLSQPLQLSLPSCSLLFLLSGTELLRLDVVPAPELPDPAPAQVVPAVIRMRPVRLPPVPDKRVPSEQFPVLITPAPGAGKGGVHADQFCIAEVILRNPHNEDIRH